MIPPCPYFILISLAGFAVDLCTGATGVPGADWCERTILFRSWENQDRKGSQIDADHSRVVLFTSKLIVGYLNVEQVHLRVAALNFLCMTYNLHSSTCASLLGPCRWKNCGNYEALMRVFQRWRWKSRQTVQELCSLLLCQYDLTTHVKCCWLRLGCQGKRKPARLHNCWYSCLTAKKQCETGLNICYQTAAFENKRIHKPALANLTLWDRYLWDEPSCRHTYTHEQSGTVQPH